MERSARVPRRRRPGWADDLLLAAGLAGFGWWATFGVAENQPSSRPPDAAAWALLGLACAAVAVRRRHPPAVLGVTAAAIGGWLALRYPYGPVFLPLCVAVYTVAAATPRHRFPAVAAWVAVLLALLVAVAVSDGRERLYDQVPAQLPSVLLAMATLLGVPLWIGWAARVRRDRAAQELRQRADDERLRVARELHDVVSHSIAMINFRAGVALHVIDRRPGEAKAARVRVAYRPAEVVVEVADDGPGRAGRAGRDRAGWDRPGGARRRAGTPRRPARPRRRRPPAAGVRHRRDRDRQDDPGGGGRRRGRAGGRGRGRPGPVPRAPRAARALPPHLRRPDPALPG